MLSGNRPYIMTTSRITSGEEWKYRNGEAGFRGRGIALTYPTNPLTTNRCNPFDSAHPTDIPAAVLIDEHRDE